MHVIRTVAVRSELNDNTVYITVYFSDGEYVRWNEPGIPADLSRPVIF